MLLAIADESGLETKDMVMVGDAVLDMQMAKNAGSDSVAVSYGASPKERLLETASLGVADNVPQLGRHSRTGKVSFLASYSKWGRYCPFIRGFPYSLTIDRSEVTPIQ